MLDNTARQLEEPLVQRPEPIVQPTPEATPQVQAAPSRAFSPFEKILAAFCGLAACVMCLLYLQGTTQLNGNNRTYQDVQAKIATQSQGVTDLKQTVGELSNSNRLSNFAKAHGLTVIEGNIKRVNK